MYYPLNIFTNYKIFPLFGDQLEGKPHIFDFTSNNPKTFDYDTNNFDEFQKIIFDELSENNKTWGIGKYIEERKGVLRNYTQMIDEGRIYHLGLDIIVPKGFQIFAPLNSKVFMTGKEEGIGNYGGYVILEHNINNTKFWSFYGHLNSNHIVSQNQQLESGEPFGIIGEHEDSGGWFTHTHLQVLTERAVEENKIFQGYVSKENLDNIFEYFPSPYPLFNF